MNQMRTEIATSALAPAQIEALVGEQQFCFANDFVGFAGHFPEYPILPAVLQVLMAQMVAETIIGSTLSVVTLNRAKFMRQVRPDDLIDVQVTCREKNGTFHCASELVVDEQRVASFSLVLNRDTQL